MSDATTMNMLLGATKTKKARKPRAKSIRVGVKVMLFGDVAVITGRDEKYKSAWFVSVDGKSSPYSFSRDMLTVL